MIGHREQSNPWPGRNPFRVASEFARITQRSRCGNVGLWGTILSGLKKRPGLKKTSEIQCGFTLVELLAVIAIITILCALLLPALASSKESGRRTRCTSNLRQLALAAQMYWDENEEQTFRYLVGETNGGIVYWFGWIKPGAEGDREFDATYGAL